MTKDAFCYLLERIFRKHGFSLNPLQQQQFATYWSELKRWNSQINLTAIRNDQEIIIKHFLDALGVLHHFSIKAGDAVIDIGTGAGFPGIPLKIYIPDIQLTLVESSSKKGSFLRFLISRLNSVGEHPGTRLSWSGGHSHVRVIIQRAEECAKQPQHIKAYDWVLTRYLASLANSVSYCLPLLKTDGTWIAYKSCDVQAEIQAATPQLQSVGGKVESISKSHIAELNRTYLAILYN